MPAHVPVAVVIPAHNAASTLASALESVRSQTVSPAEIIVVDDASTDGTAGVAGQWGDIELVRLPRRRGAAAARNAGIAASRSPWTAFLDADDEWLPQKLERQWQVISARPDASLVFCASLEFAADGTALGDTFRGAPVSTGNSAWKALLKANFVATPTVVAPRTLLLQLGGFDESLTVGEDQDMWIRLARAGSLAYVAEALVRVHVRPESLSSFRPSDQARYVLPMIERHVRELREQLTPAERRAILGERLTNAGRIAFANGCVLNGASFMLRAALLGYRPISAAFMLARGPLGAFAKRLLARRQAAL